MVRVINLIAENTIESGMLDVHRFKKSMFSGVLEGGSDTVFMEGGRLNRFMKTVEAAAGSIPKHSEEKVEDLREADQDQRSALEESEEEDPTAIKEKASTPSFVDLAGGVTQMKSLLDAGASFLTGLGRMLEEDLKQSKASGRRVPGIIQIKDDPETGQKMIQFPLPGPASVEKFAHALNAFTHFFKAPENPDMKRA